MNKLVELCKKSRGFERHLWFDTQMPCKKKVGSEQFVSEFDDLLRSLSANGFDVKRSLVPVTADGYMLNGAHRVAAAIAMRLPCGSRQYRCSKSKR